MRIAAVTIAAAMLLGSPALRGQTTLGDPYSGHSFSSGVELLGIEPFETNSSVPSSPSQPDFSGRAVQVQYPLDNRDYEGPSPETLNRYPSSAPGGALASPGTGSRPVYPQPTVSNVDWVTLESATWEATWLNRGGGGEALGIVTNEFRANLEFPTAPWLSVTPRFGWHLLDGPTATDLPGQLYDASLETVVSLPLRETFFMQAAISPSIFTDAANTGGDAFRLPGRLLFFWTASDVLTLSAGVVYLDRDDVGFLPSAGLIYKPNDDWKFEMLIPRPRVAWRYSSDGDMSRWAYVVGEFGGGSWAIERAGGVDDVATLSDYRLMLGWEQTGSQGPYFRLEGGYVFSRTLDYSSNAGNLNLPATALVRFAVSY